MLYAYTYGIRVVNCAFVASLHHTSCPPRPIDREREREKGKKKKGDANMRCDVWIKMCLRNISHSISTEAIGANRYENAKNAHTHRRNDTIFLPCQNMNQLRLVTRIIRRVTTSAAANSVASSSTQHPHQSKKIKWHTHAHAHICTYNTRAQANSVVDPVEKKEQQQ